MLSKMASNKLLVIMKKLSQQVSTSVRSFNPTISNFKMKTKKMTRKSLIKKLQKGKLQRRGKKKRHPRNLWSRKKKPKR